MGKPNYPTRRCECPTCGAARVCVIREDGSWALCRVCGVMMKPVHVLQDRRDAKAKAELREQDS